MSLYKNDLFTISPIDGRYKSKTQLLSKYFSEFALIKYRIFIEIEYFIELSKLSFPKFKKISPKKLKEIKNIYSNFSEIDAYEIKNIESEINHDVKAVEYYIRNKFKEIGLENYVELIHFGLTSQDINNTAIPLMLKDSINEVLIPSLNSLIKNLNVLYDNTKNIPMIARTHGQAATPTTFGKEIKVFLERLNNQLKNLRSIPNNGKFGGASGNLNAHYISMPNINWDKFSDNFLNKIGLLRSKPTTQIEHYDNMGALFHCIVRINLILIDMCRDIWHYISIGYIKQKINKKEVGSSAMPHKVNPIDFENAEGNLMLANSQFSFLANKLPISRLQRDLTDSTVSRNIGVPIAHTIISLNSIIMGLNKIEIDKSKIDEDLDNNWAVISEAIQTILRRENIKNPYQLLKELTRGNKDITQKKFERFINNLPITDKLKKELLKIRPHNYLGNSKL